MGIDDLYFPLTADDLTKRGPSSQVTRNGTEGRVYGGACDLIHVQDGKREAAGKNVADYIDTLMRSQAKDRTFGQLQTQKLCPGCYMIVLFNAAVALAEENGQPLAELGKSMANAFSMLAAPGGTYNYREEIEVLLDAD